jgi:hypothetical protein
VLVGTSNSGQSSPPRYMSTVAGSFHSLRASLLNASIGHVWYRGDQLWLRRRPAAHIDARYRTASDSQANGRTDNRDRPFLSFIHSSPRGGGGFQRTLCLGKIPTIELTEISEVPTTAIAIATAAVIDGDYLPEEMATPMAVAELVYLQIAYLFAGYLNSSLIILIFEHIIICLLLPAVRAHYNTFSLVERRMICLLLARNLLMQKADGLNWPYSIVAVEFFGIVFHLLFSITSVLLPARPLSTRSLFFRGFFRRYHRCGHVFVKFCQKSI